MAEEAETGRRRRAGVALPLGLLALFVLAVLGVILWVESTQPPKTPVVTVELTPPESLPEPLAAAPPPAQPEPAPAPEPAPPTPSPPPAVAPTAPPQAERPASPVAKAPPPPPAPPPAPAIKPPPMSRSGELSVAPDPALVEKTPDGPLPVIAPDGRRAWQVYARPFERGDRRPRIAILISGLGPSGAATEAAIQGLPGAVSLAFWPYADRIDNWIRLARAAGHEVLLNLPMEPENYPAFDPGPKTLLTSLSPQQNLERLEWALSRVTGYVGVVDSQGSRFTASRRDIEPVLDALNRRGLIFVDSRSTPLSLAPEVAYTMGLPWTSNARFIDDAQVSRAAIDARLRELEGLARLNKQVLGIGSPYPVTLERISAWAATLQEKGIALAPVTAVLEGKPQG